MKHKVYLLPGTMCNQRLWHKLFTCAKADLNSSSNLNAQEQQLEFIHIPIPANKNFEQLASWLNAYFQEDKVCLLGFSLGGYLASYFAVNYPNRVKRLFIVGNSPCVLNPQEILQRQELLDYIVSEQSIRGYKGISNKRARLLLGSSNSSINANDTNTNINTNINTIKLMDKELGVEQFISQMTHTTERDDLLLAMSNLMINMAFYYSEDDPLVNTAWLKKLSANNRLCTLIPTKGNGHMLPIEKPEELTSLIHSWLMS